MHFLSNFRCKIIFMCSVNFWHPQDSNSLFKRRDLLMQVAYCGLAQRVYFTPNGDHSPTQCNSVSF